MIRVRSRHARLAALVSILALAACGSDGDDGDGPFTVVVSPDGATRFEPSTLTVPVGATVTFRFAAGGHNVVSGSGCAADGTFCSPDDTSCASAPTSTGGTTYVRTFPAVGTFPYFCSPHCALGMTGVIVVQ